MHRTVIAKLPKGLNALVKTDLDGDGEPELLAICTAGWRIGFVWNISDRDSIADPRVWLIRFPLTNPQVTQLPYVCCLNSPTTLPLLRAVPVEEGEWRDYGRFRQWRPRRLGWLQMRNGQTQFEPFGSSLQFKGFVAQDLDGMAVLFVDTFPVHLPTPAKQPQRSQRFAFRLRPDGTWQRLDPTKVQLLTCGYNQIAKGDFDGDGMTDTLMLRQKGRREWVEVRWGNEAPPTLLPTRHFNPSARFAAADVDNDGRWELVTVTADANQWRLTVWKFHLAERRFAAMAQLTATMPVPLPIVVELLSVVDLDSDGCKDFVLAVSVLTRRRFAVSGLGWVNVPDLKPVAAYVVWWQGNTLQVRSFAPDEVEFTLLTTLQPRKGQRLAITTTEHWRHRFALRLLSLRPLRVQFWETVEKMRLQLRRIPDGAAALDLRRWTKVAELPAIPKLWGDWDKDGCPELLLEQTMVRKPPLIALLRKTPLPVQTVARSVIYLARWDGEKLRLAKLNPPSPAGYVAVLPLSTKDSTALFVLWKTPNKTLLERIRW